jgi:hypothetical protein
MEGVGRRRVPPGHTFPTAPMEQSGETDSRGELGELLEASRRPGVILTRDQMRALIGWRETPEGDRAALRSALEATRQQVEAKPLAPQQRRGHVSWLDRLQGLFRR